MRVALKRFNDYLGRWPGVLLTVAAVFWGGNTVAGRLAVDQITPFTLVFLRWVMVIGVLWPIYGGEVRKYWPEIRPRLFAVVLMSVLGFTGFNVLFYFAAHYTTAVNMGILQGALPIFVLVGAFVAHRSRPTLIQLGGVAITTLGVLVVAGRGDPSTLMAIGLNWGDLAMLVACVFYAFYTIALRDRPKMPAVAYFTVMAVIAGITSLPLVVIEALTTGLAVPTLQGFLVTAFVAIFPSCLAQLIYLRGVDLIGPGRAGMFLNLIPVFSAVLGVGLLGEPFAMFHAVGLILVIAGIWLAERRTEAGTP